MAVKGGITLPVGLDLKDVDGDARKIAQRFKEVTQQIEIQSKKVDDLRTRLAGLEDGSIAASTREIQKMQTEFEKASASVEKTKAEINSLGGQLTYIYDNAFKDPVSQQPVFTQSEQAQIDAINAKLDQLEPKLEADRKKAAELGEALKNATGAATQSEIEATKQKLAEAETKLDGLKIKAEDAGEKLKAKMNEVNPALSSVSSGFDKCGKKMISIAKSALIFAVLTKALAGVREVIGNVIMSDTAFQNSLYQLQAAIWAAFSPVFDYVIPALKKLVDWITAAMISIGKLIASLTGKSYSSMVAQGKALKDRANSYGKAASGANKATGASKKHAKAVDKETKAMQKQLAAFDELNILQEDKTEPNTGTDSAGAGGGAGGSGGLAGTFQDLGNATQKAQADIAALHMVIGAALCTVGVVLLFMGHIRLGLGFIVAGIAEFGVGLQQYTEMDYGSKISKKLNTILGIVGLSLLALGVILFFHGYIPLGLGAIIAGIGVLAVKSVVSQPYDGADIKTTFLRILKSAAYYMLCIGLIVLLIPHMLPIGLGLIIGGIGLLKYTQAQLGSNEAYTEIDKFFKKNEKLIVGIGLAICVLGILLCCVMQFVLGMGLIIAGAGLVWAEATINNKMAIQTIDDFFKQSQKLIVGIALSLLVIGIVLCAAGVSLPLGIGLIAVGALALAKEVSLNWDYIKDKTISFLDKNKGLIIGVSAAMLVLGIILLFTGVGIPLALGLIAAGGGILAAELVANWSFITDKVKDVWETVKSYWNNHIKKYFTASWWGDLAKTAINGFIEWFIKGLNKLINEINSLGFDMPDVLGGGHVGFNIPSIPVPHLAQGAVIPPNREFLAVLGDQKRGTNIEAPLDTIKQAVAEVLANSGYSGGNQPIILELDGREVGRTFGKAIQQEANRVGNSFMKTKLVF